VNSEKLLRKVALAAAEGKPDKDGWIQIDAPKATAKELSLAIMEAHERGIAKGCDLTCNESEYPEWKTVGRAASLSSSFEKSNLLKKAWTALIFLCTGLIVFLAWAIPALINLFNKW
jgi:hypothetical protein